MTEWSQTVLQYIVETQTISEEDSDPISNGVEIMKIQAAGKHHSWSGLGQYGNPRKVKLWTQKSKIERSQPYQAMKSNHREN